MSSYLFAYGTLMLSNGHSMARRLASEADFVGPAQVVGRLFDLGKWPGLVQSDDPAEIVHGEVWRLRSESSLAWLDEYEGIRPGVDRPEYERMGLAVRLADGAPLAAEVYVYRWPVAHAARIPSGRWRGPGCVHLPTSAAAA
jgi:gamma-glutamylcyclotransferase (GGCT)/AIG2-like uncharacterized protein YtfP